MKRFNVASGRISLIPESLPVVKGGEKTYKRGGAKPYH